MCMAVCISSGVSGSHHKTWQVLSQETHHQLAVSTGCGHLVGAVVPWWVWSSGTCGYPGCGHGWVWLIL